MISSGNKVTRKPAINGLIDLIQFDLISDFEAKVYLSIAEIYFEQGMKLESMEYLEKAAEIIQEPNEKGQLYYRIASLSFEDMDYSRAISAYKHVIKNSKSKKQVQEGHLKTVQIYRLNGDLDLAGNTIKNMLLMRTINQYSRALRWSWLNYMKFKGDL
jgi:tetratricopeptide (TPR) repeat protein